MILDGIRIKAFISDKKKNRPESVDDDDNAVNDDPHGDQHCNCACNDRFLKKSFLIEP